MKKTRKLLSILLALVMALSLCTVAFAEGDEPAPLTASGTHGENITWTIADGTLTIEGTGVVEPLVRELNGEHWVSGYYDEETQEWVDGHYEVGPYTEEYYSWDDALIEVLLQKLGFESEEEAEAAISALTEEEQEAFYLELLSYEKEIMDMVPRIVLGEGITGIAGNAFSFFNLLEINLPATLTTVEAEAFDMKGTKTLVIKNADFDFESNYIPVYGFANGLSYETYEAYDAAWDEAYDVIESYSGTKAPYWVTDYLPSSAYSLYQYAIYIENEAAIINDNDEMDPQEKEEALNNLAQREAQYVSYFDWIFEYFEITEETCAAASAALVAVINGILDTEFANAGELYVLQPKGECDCEVWDEELEEYVPGCNCCYYNCQEWNEELGKYVCTCGDECDCCRCDEEMIQVPAEAFKAACDAYSAPYEAARAVVDGFESYQLGTAPEIVDPEMEETYTLTPVPWLTVYGPYNSTARTACATSQVKFVSFEEQEFDAYKADAAAAAAAKAADGDSNASKKLITDAQAAINALAYDGTKTLDENKAAVDAINTKLASDLAAQREADKPVVPEEKPEEKPDDKPADDKNDDGGYSNNAFMKFIQKIIDFFKNIFSKIFG